METATGYFRLERNMAVALEQLKEVRTVFDEKKTEEGEVEGEASQREEFEEGLLLIIRRMQVEIKNFHCLGKTCAGVVNTQKNISKRIGKLFEEDYSPYPEPEMGVSHFDSLSEHEELLPFEKQTDTVGESLEGVILF